MFKRKVTKEELGQYDYQVSYILSGVDRKIDELADTLGYTYKVEYTPDGVGEVKLVKKPVKRKGKK